MQINLQETAVPIKNEESGFWKQPSALEDYPDQIPQVFEGKWYLHLGSLREEISLAVENKQIKPANSLKSHQKRLLYRQ